MRMQRRVRATVCRCVPVLALLSRRLATVAFVLALGGVLAGSAGAAPPSVTTLSPNGFNLGVSVPVKISGKLDGAGCRVWTDDPAVVFSQPDLSGKCTVMVGSLAAHGIHLMRVVNHDGASLPLRFSIGSLPLFAEKEPNDAVDAPQAVEKLPAWIHGGLEKAGDVDGYLLKLKKANPVCIRLDAYSLGSPVDCFVQIMDVHGVPLMTASDGRNLDPECVFTPPEDGSYMLRVAGFPHPPTADVGFTGGSGRSYQLTVSEAPVVNRVFPAAVAPNGKTSVELCGFGIPREKKKAELSSFLPGGSEDIGLVTPALASGPLCVVIARYPIQALEASTESAVFDLKTPCVLGARLAKGVPSAGFRVTMKAGEKMKARFWSQSIGLGMEGKLSVSGPDGQAVAANDYPSDVFAEPSVSWSAAKDGVYTLNVSGMFHGAESERECVLELAAPSPFFAVTVADGKPVRLEYGKTATLKVKVALANGWKEALVARVHGLPQGVFAAETPVPEKGGEFDVVLSAASNASQETAPAFVSVWTKTSPPSVTFAQYPVRGDTMRGNSDTDFRREIWVSVGPPGSASAGDTEKK
jgi:hypothetical protein